MSDDRAGHRNGWTLAPAAPTDQAQVCQLLGDTFGLRDDQASLVARWLSDADRLVLLAFDAPTQRDHATDLLGVGVCGMLTAQGRASYEAILPGFDEWLEGRVAGCVQTLAVRPSARRSGLGTALANEMLTWLRTRGCEVVVGVSWQHGGPDHSGHLYEAGAFRKIASSHTFFAEEQARSGQACARCQGCCTCVAWLYARE